MSDAALACRDLRKIYLQGKVEVPVLREIVPGHVAACHLHDAGVKFPLAS